MKAYALVLIVPLLGGCPAQPKKDDGAIVITKEVKIPIKETCKVTVPAPPIWMTEVIDREKASPLQKSQTVMAELEQVRSYLQQVIAEAKKCE